MLHHLHTYLYLYLLGLSVLSVAAWGVPHNAVWQGGTLGSDALGYAQYAHHLAEGSGYTMSGSGFDPVREPGYPAFLALVYLVFGVDNVWAVLLVQTLLLSLVGYLAYLILRTCIPPSFAAIAACVVVLLPYYGYYAAEFMTELPFAFLLLASLYLSLKLYQDPGNYRYQLLLGLVFAAAALTRAQMLLFPLLFGVAMLILYRERLRAIVRPLGVVAVAYLVPILLWSGVVYAHTGNFMITEGRQEMLLHVRSVRSELSYGEQVGYAKEWLLRSISGGEQSNVLVGAYDLKAIKNEYKKIATSPERIREIKEEDVRTIMGNLDRYLFGNTIEALKLLYIEHDYSNYLNRYVRLGSYLLMYGLFIAGLAALLLKRTSVGKDTWAVAGFALLLIGYHVGVLTFLETVPRFNTPLHALYLLVGAAGVWQWYRLRLPHTTV